MVCEYKGSAQLEPIVLLFSNQLALGLANIFPVNNTLAFIE
jgi:hypothetical protein